MLGGQTLAPPRRSAQLTSFGQLLLHQSPLEATRLAWIRPVHQMSASEILRVFRRESRLL